MSLSRDDLFIIIVAVLVACALLVGYFFILPSAEGLGPGPGEGSPAESLEPSSGEPGIEPVAEPVSAPQPSSSAWGEYSSALDSGDAGACASLSDAYLQERCYYSFVSSAESLEWCERFSTDYLSHFGKGSYRDWCIVTVEGPASKCGGVSLGMRDLCFSRAAADSGDVSLCDSLASGRDECYYGVAVASGDGSLCADSGDFLVKCYQDIALLTGDSSWCDYLAGDYRDWCLARLA